MRELLQQALEALMFKVSPRKVLKVIAAIEEELAKPTNEFHPDWDTLKPYHDRIAELEAQLAKPEQSDLRKAAEMALESLEELDGLDTETECVTIYVTDEIEALRQALAQPEYPLDKKADNARELGLDYESEQEPVAFLFNDMTWTCQKSWTNEITGGTPVYAKPFKNYEEPVAWMDKEDCGDMTFTLVKPTYDNDLIPLYTAPPRKPWVGLTDEDIKEMYLSFTLTNNHGEPSRFVRLIEAKLKEKNT